MRFPFRLAAVVVLGFCAPLPASAAPPAKKAATSELAVDVVDLKPAGPSFRGAILNRAADGALLMAVSRQWLKTSQPAIYEKESAGEAEGRKEQLAELLERIDAWREEHPDHKKLQFYLGEERDRIEKLVKAGPEVARPAEESYFLLVEIPAARIRKATPQPPQKKVIALAAWQEGFENVETRSVSDLEKELKNRKIDVSKLSLDLTDRLPPQRDSDSQWTARKALVEYEYLKPVDFQGTGDVLVRVGEEAKAPPVASLIGDLFNSQLSRELGDLLGNPAGPKKPAAAPFEKATRAADKEGATGLRVTRVDQNLAARRVSVEQSFLARMSDGTWHVVWSMTETADASKSRPEAEERIEKDPQVKQALNLVQQLGLGGDGDETVQTAIRFGAAVMDAQSNADARFFRFRDSMLKHLDGPPFPWAGVPAAKAK